MTSVQNHQLPLSGNKLKNISNRAFTAVCLGAVLAVSSCTPKTTGVLRNPTVHGGNVGSETTKPTTKAEEKKNEEAKKAELSPNIALLLPFQLDKVAGHNVVEADVKRSALALDFYQGFQLGVNEASKKNGNIKINVMDSQDSEIRNVTLAATKDVTEASLIVGPVYPKEIRSFARANTNKKVLQVSPLAASMPTEFNISNLVSITPPIRIHMRAVANEINAKYRAGDVVIVFDARDNDHRQFIDGFDAELKRINPNVIIKHIASTSQLGSAMPDVGYAFVVCGTTERTQLRSFVSTLDNLVSSGNSIKLFGHPLWERIDFSPYDNFYRMDPTITSESHLKVWSSEVQNFQRNYKTQFKVDPSDYAYKGYDAGRFFTTMLNKYGQDYAEKIVDEKYNGIFSNYQFSYNPQWGYVNQSVNFRTYRNGSFQ
ncbi:ABC transporter substrate-binding protein [Sphingobacterium sp. 1.A.4]|uniref:ABC transporter substrate-binding protein n=1 Tax=Sphingobacterium sp. 1.A.4 TaxID=2044603 RepID=UPI000C0BE8EE|nr:hypothetical protein [Sphingobacterium sp. 1.A.4]